MALLPIGRLSKETGVKIPTIRYYESVGLLPEPERTDSNRRSYGPEAARRLRFIRHARELGFEVDAIRQLLDLAKNPQAPCDDADRIARVHLADIDSKIERLSALREEVARMIHCDNRQMAECRVIEVLADHGQCLHDRH